jgi:TolB-like protein/Tfp pilus assembly protein PilF
MDAGKIAQYRILEKLGEGGMGEVYKAEDTKLQRTVAIKFLSPRPEAAQLLLQEARAAAALDHPNICTVHEIGEAEGRTYLVMAFIPGQTVKELIAKRPLPLDQALDIARQALEGLRAAHEAGIVHYDIKSANLMATPEGRVRITDFGLAGCGEAYGGASSGSPGYMSPEQALGQKADRRSDLWSMGIVLYEMLAGRRPFEGESVAAITSASLHGSYEPLTALRTGIPRELDRIIARALTREASGRYQYADDFLIDLRRIKEPVESRRKWIAASALGSLGAAAAYFVWPRKAMAGNALAVLPLRDVSADKQDYFCEGMTEALINDLAKIGSMRVISRTSVMRYRDTAMPLPAIARELRVSFIVEGSIMRAGDQVRINVHLIDAAEERQLLARSYERPIRDVLALHNEIARSIAGEIALRLLPAEQASINAVRAVNATAYEAYLRGRYSLNRRALPGASKRALEYLTKAIEIDPLFALAHASLAELHSVGVGGRTRREAGLKAIAAAERAIQLDPAVPDAYGALGWALMNDKWDWNGARQAFEKGLQINPHAAVPLHFYSHLLVMLKRPQEALIQMERAIHADPFNLVLHTHMIWHHYMVRDYGRALAAAERALAMEPNNRLGQGYRSRVYWALKRYDEALADLQEDSLRSAATLALMGQRDKAMGILSRYESQGNPPKYTRALVFRALGDVDQAVNEIEKAMEEGEFNNIEIAIDPYWDPIRENRRFQNAVRRLGLPP